jgi:hypothetical protein
MRLSNYTQYLEQNLFSLGEVMYKRPQFAALFDRLREPLMNVTIEFDPDPEL